MLGVICIGPLQTHVSCSFSTTACQAHFLLMGLGSRGLMMSMDAFVVISFPFFFFFFFFVVKLRVSPSTLPNPPPSSSSSSSSQANPLDSLGESLAIITATSCSVAIVVVLCAVVGRARPLSRAIPNHMQNLQQRSPAYIRNQTHQKSVQTPRSMQRCGFDILQLEDSVQGGPTWCLLQRCTEADVLCCCHLAYKCELVL